MVVAFMVYFKELKLSNETMCVTISTFQSIFKMRGDTDKIYAKAEIESLQIFVNADKDKNGTLSEKEFVVAAKSSTTIAGLLQFLR